MKSIPPQFLRNIGVLAEHEQRRLLSSTVAVVGLGCTGCAVVEFLARAGVGGFILVDGDRYDETNINRQLYAKVSTVGMYKVEAARAEILDINPDAEVEIHRVFLHSTDDRGLLKNADLVVNGVDDPYSMVVLHRISKALLKPSVFLLSGVIPFQGVCCVIPSDSPVDYEALMGLPTLGRSLDDSHEAKKGLFDTIARARVRSALERGAIPGQWVDTRLAGGSIPSYGITSNITSLIAANEAVKTLIKRPTLWPVCAPDLIYFDGATCTMSIRRPDPQKLWFQGDF